MPQIVMSLQSGGVPNDGQVRQKAFTFLERLSGDDTRAGLHIEPIQNSRDPRVRTGRVDQFWRAVLFKLQGHGQDAHYVYLGVWAHDDAIEYARKATLSVNPVNGIAELILDGQPDPVEREIMIPPPPAMPEAAQVEERNPVLVRFGVMRDDLVDNLGLEPGLADRALAAMTEDDLLLEAATAVEWQGLALIDLAAGMSVADVKDRLQIAPEPTPVDDSDERLIKALRHPAAQMQFAFIEDDQELRQAIEGGDFAAWRVFLHPEQRKYASTPYSGAFRLTGGAGTGKTVVLLHRARMLHRADPSARIVLTTFTRNLADMMRSDLQALDAGVKIVHRLGDPGVFVTGIDALASAVLKSNDGRADAVQRVLVGRSDRVQGRNSNAQELWREAIDRFSGELPSEARSSAFFEAEYALVVLPNRISSQEDYFRVRRPGRGVALDRTKRKAVWDVVRSYRASSAIGSAVDFAEAAAIAAEMLVANTERPADHVLVDEGQDLNPPQWQLVRALVAEGPDDIFIAEDAQQRIYGQRVVLGHLDIKIVGRSRRLSLNYRTTAQNLRFAVGVLEGSYAGLEDNLEEADNSRSARSGPVPRLLPTASLTEELEKSSDLIQAWLDEDVEAATIGILVRDSAQASQVQRGLEERGVASRIVTNQTREVNLPQVMTMHRAKGMEFSRVLIFGAEKGLIPASYALNGLGEADREDALLRERSLFYVAATRARDELAVLWSGDPTIFLDRLAQQSEDEVAPPN